MATIAATLIALSIYISNDVMDIETDRANLIIRPVVQEVVSKKDALTLSTMLAAAGVAVGLYINLATFLLCIAGVLLGFMYSFSPIYLKRRFILKQVAVAGGGLISSLTGGAAVGMISSTVLFAGFIFFTYAMGVVPIVDLGDIEGDRREGRKTLPVIWGPEYTIRLAIAIMFAILISGIVGYFQLGFNLAFPILVSVISLSCIYVLYPLFNRWRDYVYCRKLVIKITILHFLLQLSIVIGSVF
ncbi:MAG: 4-hydroxybenzoate polyprenyltransferase-like prenyltransferase [Candidatus Bathyarchaeota archaeon B26-2]|nr:MAG: 4-hydroxybenzoate polyprenyltransferase-like prenyltransferase [Candidatus Bathyarchaeota archaeon B26-2]